MAFPAPPLAIELNELPAAVVLLSADGQRMLRANALARALLGLDDRDLPALGQLLDAGQLQQLHATLRTLPEVVETRGWILRRPGGSSIRVGIRGQRIAAGDYLLILEDRTADERVQAALLESEQRWSNTAANVPGALFRYILRADGKDAVSYMSDGCRRLWELEPTSIVQDATPMWEMVLPEDLPAMQASVMESARTLANWDHRWRIRTPSGKLKWLRGIGKPMRAGEDVLWDTLILDVTQEVEGERERAALLGDLERARRLEAIGRLAGGIAHDFNNLLMVIIGSAESVDFIPGVSEEVREEVGRVREAAMRAAALTRRLLVFARKPGGTHGAVVPSVALREAERTLERMVAPGVTLSVDVGSSEWAVGLDAAEFDQVITNLVVNASVATPAGGRIAVTLRDRLAGDGEGRSCVELVVADTGRGMSEEVQAHIFEPFFTTRGHVGTGLGLATVYGLVMDVGGSIDVRSEPGHGATFTLRLPRVIGPAREVSPPVEEQRGAGERILVVDDEPSVLRAAVQALRSLGYHAEGASSAQEALLDLAAHGDRTALVLTDVVMPVMGGPELLAEVRRRWPTVRTLLMSGYAPKSYTEPGPDTAVVSKPFTRSALSVAIREALA